MKRAKPVDPMLERAERFGRGTSIEMTFAESLARFARKEVARALRAKYSKACTHHPLVHAASNRAFTSSTVMSLFSRRWASIAALAFASVGIISTV